MHVWEHSEPYYCSQNAKGPQDVNGFSSALNIWQIQPGSWRGGVWTVWAPRPWESRLLWVCVFGGVLLPNNLYLSEGLK